MNIDWTTLFATMITATIISIGQFLSTRYLARLLDHIEKKVKSNGDKH